MIVLFTDFGLDGPYVGQLHGVLASSAPDARVIDLLHTVPSYDIRAGAYLLAAYHSVFPLESVFVCVVDPGVGSARRGVCLRADQRWYVGPDNGLFTILARRAQRSECHEILWRPAKLAESFHGRDLFAPVAALLAHGEMPESRPTQLTAVSEQQWPDELAQIIFFDHYGNAITGIRAQALLRTQQLRIGEKIFSYARVFSEAKPAQAFWYENANGLVEIALNQDSAHARLNLSLGDRIEILE